MRSDYKVTYLREDRIKEIAAAFLSAHGKGRAGGSFDITDFVERTLSDYCKKKTGKPLKISPFDRANKYDEPANVTFEPQTTLHIDRHIWADAKAGDDFARLVVAHEAGHIVLHDGSAKAFSSDPSLRIEFAEREYSAEWQADTFAENFLAPDEAVRRFPEEALLSMTCGVSQAIARKRLEAYFAERRLLAGNPCECGNFSLVREQTGLRCFVCNKRYPGRV